MQALVLAALVAAAAAAPGLIGPALPALAVKPVVSVPTLAVKPVAALPKLAGRGYGLAGRGYGLAGRGYAVDYAEPRPYQYQYAVDDPQYGPMFKKEEVADGAGTVQGYYAVNLPDGRIQHVKYVADHYNGFNAEVSYEGYANHPQVARGYGYGLGGVHGVVGAGKVVAAGGLGVIGRPIGGYKAGLGVAKVGVGLLGRRAGLKPLVYGH